MNKLRSLLALTKIPIPEVLIGIVLLIATNISIFLTWSPAGAPIFWPGNAIAATILIRLKRVRWSFAVLANVAALLLSNAMVAHRPWPITCDFVCINCLEIGLMVVAFRYIWRFPYPRLSINQAAWMMIVLGIAVPGLSAVICGSVLHSVYAVPWAGSTLAWWSGHTIGACFFGPSVILFSVKDLKRLIRPSHRINNGVTFAVCLLGCYLTVRYVHFPFVTIGLLLLVGAFRLGAFGASLMSMGCGLLIITLWILGMRPMGLVSALPLHASLLELPVIALLSTVMPPIAVGLGSDARRKAVRALKLSERRFRESMDHSPIGMLITELDGTWGYTNQALRQMLGYTAEQFRAMPPGGPSKSDDWQHSGSLRRKLMSGEINYYDVTRSFTHADGRCVWTHVAVSLLRDEEGQPQHLIAQIESLAQRQLAEETLAAERERFRTTLRCIGDAVLMTDASLRITYANAAAEALLGLSTPVLENRRIDEVMHLVDPDTLKTAANLIGRSAHHGKTFRRERPCLLHRPDGSIVYITDVVSPVQDGSGINTGLVIVLRDATAEIERSRDLHHRALHDPLTGLSNRAHFNERLSEVFRRAQHIDAQAAVIAIDLDRFKAVNDSGGHAAGDAVLCKVAEVCRNAVRTSDTVARLGGDEFGIILDNCPQARASGIAQQLLAALNPVVVDWGNTHYLVHASLGLAMRTPSMADEGAWVEAADQACYSAKHQGRSRLQVAQGAPVASLVT